MELVRNVDRCEEEGRILLYLDDFRGIGAGARSCSLSSSSTSCSFGRGRWKDRDCCREADWVDRIGCLRDGLATGGAELKSASKGRAAVSS